MSRVSPKLASTPLAFIPPLAPTLVDEPPAGDKGEFVVVGAAPNPGGAPFALLAREEDGELVYAGSAFVTLSAGCRDRFWRSIEARKLKHPVVAGVGSRKASFCRPELRVRAKHLRGEAMLGHASLTVLL